MQYVLNVIMNENRDRVLLIRKNRPKWQKGKYNFVGGKVEDNENEFEAVIRETKEECDLYIYPQLIGTIKSNDFTVYVYRSIINNLYDVQQQTDESLAIFNEDSWDSLRKLGVENVSEILEICAKQKPQYFIFNY
ncbi:hypothetical protein PBI_SCTP2_402 [Salicola phage SCTP-2]|nr:hypothetical protein PBI_SCTP2_402 [Salicola phage SCTP-2]